MKKVQVQLRKLLTGAAALVTMVMSAVFALEIGAAEKGCSGSVIPCTGDTEPSWIFLVIAGVIVVAAGVVLAVVRSRSEHSKKNSDAPGATPPEKRNNDTPPQ